MPISMYEASVPVFVRAFGNLSAILRKGAEHDGDALVEARLAPDMFTLAGQVQRASDTAKGCAARLGGIDNPSFPDNEKTFADLQDRIGKTVSFLQGVQAGRISTAAEQKPIELKAGAEHAALRRDELSAHVRAAELLFPRHDGLRHSPPQRRRHRQAGYLGPLGQA